MKVTSIKPAVKTEHRYNIFVDGKYRFSLDESQLLETKLTIGREMDESDLRHFEQISDFGKKYMRVLELITRRPRSKKEIKDYARRKEWEDEVTDQVIKTLEAKGYVDDQKFAEFWLRARTGSKNFSKRRIQAELRQKGVDAGIITEALAGITGEAEKDSLRQLVAKKSRKYADDEQKLVAYLARQGFSYDDIKDVLSET